MAAPEIFAVQKTQQDRPFETLKPAFQDDVFKQTLCPSPKRRPGLTC